MALYIDSELKCRQIEIYDNFCVTVEFEMERMRNIAFTCVYRKPGSKVETLKDSLEELMVKLNENKTFIMCGDFNIDPLNVAECKKNIRFFGCNI